MNESGETTSHIMGMFYRTLRIVDNGIKPLYVFDGAPPKLKSGELAKRFQRKSEAKEAHEEAKETGTAEEVEKFSRRTVRVTREHNDDCKKLLRLMGIPYIEAPTEAEAQCAVLARAGKVYAAASEDMDTLCFDSPILLRHLTFSEQRKEPIQEIHLDKVLEGLGMDRNQVWPSRQGLLVTNKLLLSSSPQTPTNDPDRSLLTFASSSAVIISILSPKWAPTRPSNSSVNTAPSKPSSNTSNRTPSTSTLSQTTGPTKTHGISSSTLTFDPQTTLTAISSGNNLMWTGW